jgi:hypothetical protein
MLRRAEHTNFVALRPLRFCVCRNNTTKETMQRQLKIVLFLSGFHPCYNFYFCLKIASTWRQATNIYLNTITKSTTAAVLFSTSSRLALGTTQHPIRWVRWPLPQGVKRHGREAGHLPPTSAEVKKNVELYIHSPIRLHGVVLN